VSGSGGRGALVLCVPEQTLGSPAPSMGETLHHRKSRWNRTPAVRAPLSAQDHV
jgi:hypothetical protein